MDEHILSVLEFPKIRERCADNAGSILGKERAATLFPAVDAEEVLRRLDETAEACRIYAFGSPPMGGIYDIRGFLDKAKLGASLETKELADILSTMLGMRAVKKFFKELTDVAADSLKERAQEIEILGQLERELDNAIDEHGDLRDGASVELSRIRRERRYKENVVKERVGGLLRKEGNQKFFQDSFVTVRDGRYVLPVKQEYRTSFGGIVHDRSAGGATLFVEPLELVELNNDVKELAIEEQQEILRILRHLSATVAKNGEQLLINANILADIDFAFAKARLARDMDAVCPTMNEVGVIDLKAARHPLLPKDTVVPVDIRLGGDYNVLLITGPNTGGKTVGMKTLGLLTLMAQSGLFVPAENDSVLTVCRDIRADIGDEQSIEQNLSTFSAHMKNIVGIVNRAERGELLLLDELGAGTDPAEGAALATAILEKLARAKINTVATTHYSELKVFAHTTEGIENASAEFDPETFLPTYRWLYGIPGASNAFAVSRRLGLDEGILVRAKEFLRADHAKFERVIAEFEEAKRDYEEKNADLKARLQRAEAAERRAEAVEKRLNEEKAVIIRKAKDKATAMLRGVSRDAEDIIEKLKEQFNDQGKAKRQAAVADARRRLNDALDEASVGIMAKKIGKRIDPKTVTVGDTVYVTKLDQNGEVVAVKGKNLEVMLGALKTTVKVTECRLIRTQTSVTKQNVVAESVSSSKEESWELSKMRDATRELDIRGLMVNEAESVTAKFIDDAVVAGLSSVVIIYGKGTGALRKGIHEFLAHNRSVERFALADIDEGGSGATVAYLK